MAKKPTQIAGPQNPVGVALGNPAPLPNITTPEMQNLTPQKPQMPKHMQRPMKHKVKLNPAHFMTGK